MSENETNEGEVIRLYELGVNLVPTLEDKTQEEFESLKKLIETKGGKVSSSSTPVSIPLAYTMVVTVDSKNQKYNTASFGWIKFKSNPEVIADIKEDLDLNTNVLRFVILKTTEEASTDAKDIAEALQEKSEPEERPRRNKIKKDDEEEVEIETENDEEEVEDEIDEAIDDLVEEDK